MSGKAWKATGASAARRKELPPQRQERPLLWENSPMLSALWISSRQPNPRLELLRKMSQTKKLPREMINLPSALFIYIDSHSCCRLSRWRDLCLTRPNQSPWHGLPLGHRRKVRRHTCYSVGEDAGRPYTIYLYMSPAKSATGRSNVPVRRSQMRSAAGCRNSGVPAAEEVTAGFTP